MIKIETVVLRGNTFKHTWSDAGMKIERDGIVYDDAYDPVNTNRVYTETNEKIEGSIEEESQEQNIFEDDDWRPGYTS